MPWTETTRPHYARRGRRYTSDTTDAEWALVAQFLPPPKPTGRPRTTELRDVLDAILYMAATGCQWAMLPKDRGGLVRLNSSVRCAKWRCYGAGGEEMAPSSLDQ